MYLSFLKSNIHTAKVLEFELHYEGSISADSDYMGKVGIFKNEKCNVVNLNNESQLTSYAVAAEGISNKSGVNGATARTAQTGFLAKYFPTP